MEELVYNNEIIELHRLYRRWGTTLRRLPHGGSQFKYDIACLDMDEYEKAKSMEQHRKQRKTTDTVIGVKELQGNTDVWLMLVELKLEVTTGNSIGKSECVGKVNHTMDILNNDAGVYHNAFFVFPKDVVQKFILMFNEWNRSSNHSRLQLQCVGIDEFNNAIKPEKSNESLPLSTDTINNDLLSLASNDDLSGFWQKEEFWFNKLLTYRGNNQRTEARSIAEGIRRALEEVQKRHEISAKDRRKIGGKLTDIQRNLRNKR